MTAAKKPPLNLRDGGNYTRPVPYSKPMMYEACIAFAVVGIYTSHAQAEQRLRQEFQDVPLKHIDANKDVVDGYW